MAMNDGLKICNFKFFCNFTFKIIGYELFT
jgi:hypothetical protein